LAYINFASPFYLSPGNTRTVYVQADISATAVLTGFMLRLASGIDIDATNVPSGAISVSASNSDSFAMDSDLCVITTDAYDIKIGHENLMPVSVIDGATGLNALKISFTNTYSIAIGVTSVAVVIKNRDGIPINASDVITNIYYYDSSMALITSQATTAQSKQTVLLPAFTVSPGLTEEITIAVDIVAEITESFYIELENPADVLTDPAAAVVPVAGDFFGNMKSSSPSIQPKDFDLSFHGYPNPFSPSKEALTIEYYIGSDSEVTIRIFTIYGRFVRAVVDKEIKTTGLHYEDTWDGKNSYSFEVKSGVYLMVLEATSKATGDKVKKIEKIVVFR
jgi:hypothetical protein